MVPIQFIFLWLQILIRHCLELVFLFTDLSRVLAHAVQWECVLRRGQPCDVLPASTGAHQHLLLPHLEESLLSYSSRRTAWQRSHAGAPLQGQGHQDASSGDRTVRLLLAASVRHHYPHQTRWSHHARHRRVAHLQLPAVRSMARRQQLLHQPHSVRVLQSEVPCRLPGDSAIRLVLLAVVLRHLQWRSYT